MRVSQVRALLSITSVVFLLPWFIRNLIHGHQDASKVLPQIQHHDLSTPRRSQEQPKNETKRLKSLPKVETNTLIPQQRQQQPTGFLLAPDFVDSVASKYKARKRYVFWKVSSFIRLEKNLPNFQFCSWRKNKTKGIRNSALPQMVQSHNTSEPYLLHMELDCGQVLRKNGFGTGNWVQMTVLLRHAAAETVDPVVGSPQVDLLLTCKDAAKGASSEVLPWLMGYFPAPTLEAWKPHRGPKKEISCKTRGFNWVPLDYMLPWLRFQLRRMAVALVGPPPNDPTHSSHAFVKTLLVHKEEDEHHMLVDLAPSQYQLSFPGQEPLLPNIEIDQAVVHFRCGDVMLGAVPYFRFLKFSAISKRIFSNTTSIGIITQPFKTTGQSRSKDAGDRRHEVCRAVTLKFQQHLQSKFPLARVSIRNGPDETVGLAYARLTMALQAFAAPDSSFSVFPTLASFGSGYHVESARKADGRIDKFFFKNQWIENLKGDPQVRLMSEPNFLQASYTRMLNSTENITQWFEDDTMRYESV